MNSIREETSLLAGSGVDSGKASTPGGSAGSSGEKASLFRVHSDLTFLLRPSRADPYHATGNGVERVILWNDLDRLTASQFAEISAKSEAVLRAIDNEARKSLGLPSNVSDNTSASCQDHSLRTPAVGDANGHRFRSSLNIPGLRAILPEDLKTNNQEIAAFLWC